MRFSIKKLLILGLCLSTILVTSSSLILPLSKTHNLKKKTIDIKDFVKKSNIKNGSYFLPSEYELPKGTYNNEYFKNLNIEFDININVDNLNIEKIYFSDFNDDYGTAILNIENSTSILQLTIPNFLKKENWINADIENSYVFSKSVPSYFVNNQSILSELFIQGYECDFELLNHDDELGNVQILAKSKNDIIKSVFNDDTRNSDNNVLSTYNFWLHDKGWKKISFHSQSIRSAYINKKNDYSSKIITQIPFEYEYDNNNNTYLFKTFIKFWIPKIDKRIVNCFTMNVLNTIIRILYWHF